MHGADRIMSRARGLEVVERLLPERFQDADFAFVAGSVMRGTATPSSDIDLVVLYSKLPHACRESMIFEGTAIEIFVHDHATLRWFFEADVRIGRPVLIGMVAEGVMVGPRLENAARIQEEARSILAAGPPPLDRDSLDRLRYQITDRLDDLRDDRPDFERLAIGAALYTLLGDLILRGNGVWSGAGKWLPREVVAFDSAIGRDFITAFDLLFREGLTAPVLDLAEQVLAPHGGLLFDGYRSDAPAEWRA
jgi:hypothetical protein